MDHTNRQIWNFIKYRSGITDLSFGQFINDATANPQKYKQDFWAINCALDQFPYQSLAELVKRHDLHTNCAFLISCPEIAQNYQHLNFRYFPYFIAEGIAQIKKQDDLCNPDIDFEHRSNRLSCVNRFARYHRVYTYYLLCQQPNLGDAKFSFTKLETKLPDSNGLLHPVNLTIEELLKVALQRNYYSEHFESWLRKEYPHWPRQIEDYEPTTSNDTRLKCLAFGDSYANIVTETYVDDFVPTEKVVKPLLAGCLFMPVASANYMKKLESIGFDLQFEGIDYQQYDTLPTWMQRSEKVVEMTNAVYPDFEDIWCKNRERLTHNRNLFFSKTLEDHVIQQVTDIFEVNY